MRFSEVRENATCRVVRTSATLVWTPKLIADHLAECHACQEAHASQSELERALAALRVELLPAPPGLASSVVDSLGVRLAGDRVGSDGPRIGSMNRRQRVAAISTALVAAAATGLVVGHRKRAEMAH